MTNRVQRIILLISILGSIYIGFLTYKHYRGCPSPEQVSSVTKMLTPPAEKKDEGDIQTKKNVEDVSVQQQWTELAEDDQKMQMWSDVQQQYKDAVVQVFAYRAEFNWLEPHKSPNQQQASGSGFFINDRGELITNAHVVDESVALFIQMPSLGKRRIEVSIVGVSPERDLALLRLKEPVEVIRSELGRTTLPYLQLGNSDKIHRADKLMALGYPLGQQGLKSTTGVVSGREHIQGQHYIQISAAINPGSSGGPSLNKAGHVIGVNSAVIKDAQNIGYIIPTKEVKLFLRQLSLTKEPEPKLLRKPFSGIFYNNATESVTAFLGNPPPGGLYVVDVYGNSPLAKAGLKAGDMVYTINGIPIDIYGEMSVSWNLEDKISLVDYVSLLMIGDEINLEYYRAGKKKNLSARLTASTLPPVRRMFPGYEKIDWEIIGGMVVMPLTLNHIMLLGQYVPELLPYADVKKQLESALIITHIMLNSEAHRTRTIGTGAIISEVNGKRVKTLDDFRKAVRESLKTHFLTLKTKENVFVAMPFPKIMADERKLSTTYFYPVGDLYKSLEKEWQA